MMRRSIYFLMICSAAASMAHAAGQSADTSVKATATVKPAVKAKAKPKTKIQASAAAAAVAATAAAESAATAQVAATAANAAAAAEAAAPADASATMTIPSAPGLDPLVITDTLVGKGKVAGQGSNVAMHYTGWLFKSMAPRQRGRQFDSSHSRGEPLEFALGTGRVIKGWDQGIMGMKVGGKRTIIIPSYLAYGTRGAGDMIGPNADLIFDVELMDVK